MICPSCGQSNVDNAAVCSGCRVKLEPQNSPETGTQYLPNYLAPAVIVTFICCMPLGAVALIFAAQVDGRRLAGQWEDAKKSSESARLWCWIAFGVGVVFWTLYAALIIVIMILGISA